jgi:hypothetical protein
MPTIFLHRACAALLLLAAAACGSGGGEAGAGAAMAGSITTLSLTSRVTATTYPLFVYLPPAAAGPRTGLPIVYALDGEWRFDTLVEIVESSGANVIVVAIGGVAERGRDYVPPNSCTSGGGGQAAFLDFVRSELVPFVDGHVGGDRARRALLGHSHGGSFVLYALFAEAPGSHTFSSYLASDASISCMPAEVYAWEQGYAAAYGALPVRVHVSYSVGDVSPAFVRQILGRGYSGLTLASGAYAGGHEGMIPAAFSEALAFAFPPGN